MKKPKIRSGKAKRDWRCACGSHVRAGMRVIRAIGFQFCVLCWHPKVKMICSMKGWADPPRVVR